MTRFDVIYEPKGPAKEYSAWACNIVKSGQRGNGPKSCSHGCLYCYNPPGDTDGPILKDNIIERLKSDLKKLKEVIKEGERLEFTFVGDLYDPVLPDYVAVNCLRACKEAGIPFQVLTKNGPNAQADFDLYGADDLFGVTLTCDNDADSLKWEPGASLWSERIEALKEAHRRKIKTWVSFEPVVDPAQTLRLIELVAPFADKIKVGKMNSKGNQVWHGNEIKSICQNTDWGTFGTEAISLLKRLGKDFYIKDDLKKEMPAEPRESETARESQKAEMIPPQLRNSAFRFIKVAPKSKRPIEGRWQDDANYQYDSASLDDHLKAGGNYGIICGPGEVRVLDCDELARLEELGILTKFPKTFSVQSRDGRKHLYYLIPELKKKIILFDPILKDDNGQPLHLGEIQGPGTQIIGPGSIHQTTGKPYQVVDDSPIAALSLEQVKKAIEGLKTSRLEANAALLEAMPKRTMPHSEEDPFRSVRIEDIAYPRGETRRIGDEIQGAHPIHGSTTGKNFRIDLKKNTWYCDRCHAGGGPALWIAVSNGLLRCDQAESGALRGSDFQKVWKIAENEGLIKKTGPTFKRLEKKAGASEKAPEITAEDVTDEREILAGPRKGEVERTFNPDKAADAVINSVSLVATPDEKLWVYRDGYYKDDGKVIIDRLLDRVAGKLYTINASKETQKKIFLRCMAEFEIFDQNPYLLCVKNGTVDLLTGDVLDHSPNHYLTSACPVLYDPAAKPVEFIKFLKGACANDDNRLTLIDWTIACAVLAEFEYILFLTGHGSNGKHVYEAMLQAFFGSETTEAISLEELMSSRFAMGYLRRARICISSETNPDKTKTELIKKISGNDWLSSDVKNKDRVRFRAYTQLIFDSNSMPAFEDTSYGFARRFTRVVMPYKFVDHPDAEDPLQKKADRHLLEKLTSDKELSGILNLIILRAKDIALDRKIHRKEDSFERYEEQSYSVSDFMEKFIQFDPMMRDLPSWQESSDYLFKKFEEYATLTIGAKTSRKKFSHMLGKENGESSRTVRPDKLDNMPVRGFRGILFDETEYNRFIQEKRDYFTNCNTCNDSVTILNDDNNDSSKVNVTDVTIFRRICNDLELCVSLYERESSEHIVTRIVTTADDIENEKVVTMLGPLQLAEEEILERGLSIIRHLRNPVTPFVLAIHCENLDEDLKLTPKKCAAWLDGRGWTESKPGWLEPMSD